MAGSRPKALSPGSERRPKLPLRQGLSWSAGMAAVGAAVTAILLLLILATEYLPAEPMRQNLRQSIAEGSLQSEDWPRDRTLGVNQYNDCLLVMMARFRQSPWSSAVSPLVVFNDYPQPLLDPQGKVRQECSIAVDAVQSDHPREMLPRAYYLPYDRYVHGYRIPFHVLISVGSLADIRFLYRVLVVGLLLLVIVAHLSRLYRSCRCSTPAEWVSHAGFAVIPASILLFSGIDYYAQSLTHGPSDILLIAAYAWLSLRPLPQGLEADLRTAMLGGLAFGFEFLHGTLPVMLAMVLGCTALHSFRLHTAISSLEVTRSVAACIAGATGAALAKILAAMTALGPTAIAAFLGQLTYRMGGEDYLLSEVVARLQSSLHMIAWGVAPIGQLAVVAGIMSALAALLAALFGKMARWRRMAVITALLSIGVIFTWYALFRNHTAIHALFMVRMLAWPIGMGPVALLLAVMPLPAALDPHAATNDARGPAR